MSTPEPSIYVYKLVTDNGGAPCVKGKLLSLAICKPRIRKTAQEGSLIFGFGGREYNEKLIYIARVTGKLEGQDYYQRPGYADRPDCIYRVEGRRAVWKASAIYHSSDEIRKDVGLHFEHAFVLLSDDFRYLGKRGTADYKHKYRKLGALIKNLSQGHRRFYSSELRAQLLDLKDEIWAKFPRMKVGTPTDDDRTGLCNNDSPSASCSSTRRKIVSTAD
jgi:hypothetical protein